MPHGHHHGHYHGHRHGPNYSYYGYYYPYWNYPTTVAYTNPYGNIDNTFYIPTATSFIPATTSATLPVWSNSPVVTMQASRTAPLNNEQIICKKDTNLQVFCPENAQVIGTSKFPLCAFDNGKVSSAAGSIDQCQDSNYWSKSSLDS